MVIIVIIIIKQMRSRTGKLMCVYHIKGRIMALPINIMQIFWGVFKTLFQCSIQLEYR